LREGIEKWDDVDRPSNTNRQREKEICLHRGGQKGEKQRAQKKEVGEGDHLTTGEKEE